MSKGIFAQNNTSLNETLEQFDRIMAECRSLFAKKTADYGTAWRILRPSSLTDQLYIKAKRIRSIEEKGEQRAWRTVVEDDYIGLVNYQHFSPYASSTCQPMQHLNCLRKTCCNTTTSSCNAAGIC